MEEIKKKEDTYHRKNLKNDLIEAGIDLVAREGLEGFSLRKVAALCGVSHAAPYSHFENKDLLLEEMQNYISDNFSIELETAISKSENNEELLMDLGKAYLSFFMSHPNYFVFLFGKSNVNLDLTEDADPQKNY
nr:TetR/AcrR family transcriptional regulator [Treponema sp.]